MYHQHQHIIVFDFSKLVQYLQQSKTLDPEHSRFALNAATISIHLYVLPFA